MISELHAGTTAHATHATWCAIVSALRWASHAGRTAHAHHRVLLLHQHHQLHLLLLHVLGNLGVLVDFVMEKSRFEVLLREPVVLEDPIVSDGRNENGHHHHVLLHGVHLVNIFFLEEVEGKVVRFLNQLNCSLGIELFWAACVRLLH